MLTCAASCCRALVTTLPEQQSTATLQPLCLQLLEMLADAKVFSGGNLGALLQTVSSIGQLRPDIFAEHAPAFADFVLHTMLPAGMPPHSWLPLQSQRASLAAIAGCES